MSAREILAKNLRALREKKGDRQKDLANKLHVDPVTVSGWENCKKEPSFETLDKIAELYNTTTSALFAESDGLSFPMRATTQAEFVQCICAAAASRYVDSADVVDETVEDIDYGTVVTSRNIILKFYNCNRNGNRYKTDEDLAALCDGGFALVKAYKMRTLTDKIFDSAMDGVVRNIVERESEDAAFWDGLLKAD